MAATDNPERRQELIARYGAKLVKNGNQYAVLMEKFGLTGPCY